MDFATLVQNDVNDIFLQEFSQTAIFKSSTTLKEIKVQFFEEPLDSIPTTSHFAWASYTEVKSVAKNDTLEINGILYGIVDFAPDEFESGINMFLQKA